MSLKISSGISIKIPSLIKGERLNWGKCHSSYFTKYEIKIIRIHSSWNLMSVKN